MQCTNCGKFMDKHSSYYRAGWNKTFFCSYACIQDMYKDLCTEEEIEQSIEQHNASNQDVLSNL